MPRDDRAAESAKDLPLSSTVIAEQREANQKLVLAGVRAQEEADEANAARAHAEATAHELRTTTEELVAMAEFRERLIAIIGHDLRSPVSSMLVGCGLLMSHGSLTEEDARVVHRIATCGHRITRMIGQLAEFTRARLGGGFALALRSSDLGEICSSIVDEVRMATSAEIRHTTSGELTGTWDADRLSEVMSNLVGNAVEHGTPGAPVIVRSYAAGDEVKAEVENQGVCIPPEALPVIFDPFRRPPSPPNRVGDHLGLGLYIAQQIVQAHGGRLDVRSTDGTTTFRVALPRVTPADPTVKEP